MTTTSRLESLSPKVVRSKHRGRRNLISSKTFCSRKTRRLSVLLDAKIAKRKSKKSVVRSDVNLVASDQKVAVIVTAATLGQSDAKNEAANVVMVDVEKIDRRDPAIEVLDRKTDRHDLTSDLHAVKTDQLAKKELLAAKTDRLAPTSLAVIDRGAIEETAVNEIVPSGRIALSELNEYAMMRQFQSMSLSLLTRNETAKNRDVVDDLVVDAVEIDLRVKSEQKKSRSSKSVSLRMPTKTSAVKLKRLKLVPMTMTKNRRDVVVVDVVVEAVVVVAMKKKYSIAKSLKTVAKSSSPTTKKTLKVLPKLILKMAMMKKNRLDRVVVDVAVTVVEVDRLLMRSKTMSKPAMTMMKSRTLS